MTLAVAGTVAVQGIFYSALLFPLVVATFWPWWKSELGWSIVAADVAYAVAVFPAMLSYWFGITLPAWLLWASVVALWLVPPVVAWRASVLWRVQRGGMEIR